jgi:hypothetical protein
MVCDLDLLRAALQATAASIRDRDLEAIRPPEAEAVTVEVLARWAHGRLRDALGRSGAETLSVRVWETPSDFGGYAGPLA